MKKLPIEPPAAIWIGQSTRNTTNNPQVVLQYFLLVVNCAVFDKCSLAVKICGFKKNWLSEAQFGNG